MPATVLIVHDNGSTAAQLNTYLEASGFHSSYSNTVDCACQTIRFDRPDLILLDGDLLHQDPRLCIRLRHCSPEKYLPVLLLIPEASDDIASYLCGTGVDDYLCQPYSREELQLRIMLRIPPTAKRAVTSMQNVDYDFLAGLSNLSVSELETSKILQRVTEAISEVIEVRRCSITMVREDDEFGYVMASNDNADVNGLRIDLGRYPEIQETMRTGRPLMIDNVSQHPLMESVRPYLEKFSFNSILVLPMVDHQRVIGVLVLRSARSLAGFAEEEVAFCQLVANVAVSALRLAEIRKSEKRGTAVDPYFETDEEPARKFRSPLLEMAAHDLRVLVSVIDGYCLLLSETDAGNLSKEQNEIIAGLMTGSRRLVDMANNLLDYSRVEAGLFEPKKTQRDLCEIISSVQGEIMPLLHRRGIRMQIDCLDKQVPVFCDEQGIRRVFYNIVNNALKFTPDGGLIKLELSSDDEETRISIEDSGPGIEPEIIGHLFDEYRCAPSPDGKTGNGLGLSICKKIVEAHQGRIWAESSLGQGSRFTFCLPK